MRLKFFYIITTREKHKRGTEILNVVVDLLLHFLPFTFSPVYEKTNIVLRAADNMESSKAVTGAIIIRINFSYKINDDQIS